ncbi:MAG: hypothetical protein C0467_27540 [Planctomycetaceae bacterium]|nr:hypothetical protein [Planctomycetaceae bacterium]
MSDLSPLQNWLTSLGPYGYLLAALVPVVAFFVRRGLGFPASPATPPTPAPTPTDSPARLDRVAPLLNTLLNALGIAPRNRPATVADLPHATHLQLRDELEAVTAARSDAHAAALADLTPTPPASK